STAAIDHFSKVYGTANPAFGVRYSGFVNGDTAASLGGTLTFSTAATASSPVGPYAVTPAGLTSSNYTISFVDRPLDVTQPSLPAPRASDPSTAAIDHFSKVYGAANPAFGVRYSGFVNGDTAASLGGALAYATAADASSAVGTYAVTPSGLTSANYTIGFVDGALDVTPNALSVTVDSNDTTTAINHSSTFNAAATPCFSDRY